MERGLVDTLAVYKVVSADSGYGTNIANLTLLDSRLKCRFTKMDGFGGIRGRTYQLPQGVNADKVWRVTCEDSSIFDAFDNAQFVYMVKKGSQYFRVLFLSRQRDRVGVYHHASITVELDDSGITYTIV